MSTFSETFELATSVCVLWPFADVCFTFSIASHFLTLFIGPFIYFAMTCALTTAHAWFRFWIGAYFEHEPQVAHHKQWLFIRLLARSHTSTLIMNIGQGTSWQNEIHRRTVIWEPYSVHASPVATRTHRIIFVATTTTTATVTMIIIMLARNQVLNSSSERSHRGFIAAFIKFAFCLLILYITLLLDISSVREETMKKKKKKNVSHNVSNRSDKSAHSPFSPTKSKMMSIEHAFPVIY